MVMMLNSMTLDIISTDNKKSISDLTKIFIHEPQSFLVDICIQANHTSICGSGILVSVVSINNNVHQLKLKGHFKFKQGHMVFYQIHT